MEKNSPPLDIAQKAYAKIFLDSIEVPLKIGIFPHEQAAPQRVVVDVALYANPESYLKMVNLNTIIDYSILYDAITSWADRPQVHLIEDYLKELAALCFEHQDVTACCVGIKKADVFGKNQGAGVELFITRKDFVF